MIMATAPIGNFNNFAQPEHDSAQNKRLRSISHSAFSLHDSTLGALSQAQADIITKAYFVARDRRFDALDMSMLNAVFRSEGTALLSRQFNG